MILDVEASAGHKCYDNSKIFQMNDLQNVNTDHSFFGGRETDAAVFEIDPALAAKQECSYGHLDANTAQEASVYS